MMFRTYEYKKILCSAVIFLLAMAASSYAMDATARVRVAVFPILDAESGGFRSDLSSGIERELLKRDFIDIVPLEHESDDIYEMEPSHLWTGVEGGEKQGGILWNIRHQVIEELRVGKHADYALYGSIERAGSVITMKIGVSGTRGILNSDRTPVFSTGVEAATEKELRTKVREVSVAVAEWLNGSRVLAGAEEDVRRYLGRMASHAETVGKIEDYVRKYPESLPLRALLLDLYLKERKTYQQKILEEGLTMANLYDPLEISDTRYLLSLNIDPFLAAAEVYEERGDWKNAIALRDRALRLFPFRNVVHREGLARDHYALGQAHEGNGRISEAADEYNRAAGYASESSEQLQFIREGIRRTQKR